MSSTAPPVDDAAATTRVAAAPAARVTTGRFASDTGVVPSSYAPSPTVGPHREESGAGFRIGLLIFVVIGAAGLAVATTIADLIDIETTSGTPVFDTGTWKLNDLGTNNTIAAFIAAGLMVVGGLLACWRVRLGAGLAGGAGLALAGWSALIIGLAEIPLANASREIVADQTGQLAAQFTRDVGYWLLVAAGGAGVLVFLVSLALIRRSPRERSLNPWVAALGAAATLVAVAGPLVPRNEATLEQNWESALGQDLPTLFFVGRAAQLGALALCGVGGFLLVRRFGLGVAIGGFSIVSWMALTSLLELSSAPIGPAVANPGADNFPFPVPKTVADLIPHAATIGGITVAVACALVLLVEAAFAARRRDSAP